MTELNRICVFCGSSPGARPEYRSAAEELGRALVARGLELVYGGGRVGLMGAIADAVLAGGGRVTGVIPEALSTKEVAHRGLSELHVVDSMHTRKAMMADLSSAFVVLPGGIGTLEEMFEVMTWSQLGIHRKPLGLLDVGGYYEPLLRFLDGAVTERFLAAAHRDLLLVDARPERLLEKVMEFQPPALEKWLDRDET